MGSSGAWIAMGRGPPHRAPRLWGHRSSGEDIKFLVCAPSHTLWKLLDHAPFSPGCPFFALLVFAGPGWGAVGILKAEIVSVIWASSQLSSGGFSGSHVLDEDPEAQGGINSEVRMEPSL